MRALVAGAICRVCDGEGEVERKRHLGWSYPGDGTRVPITRIESAPCKRCEATGRAEMERIGRLTTAVIERIEQIPPAHPRRSEVLHALDEAARTIAGDGANGLAEQFNEAARMAAQHRPAERPVVLVIGRVAGTGSSRDSSGRKPRPPATESTESPPKASSAGSSAGSSVGSSGGPVIEAGGLRWRSVGTAIPKSHAGLVILVGRIGHVGGGDVGSTPIETSGEPSTDSGGAGSESRSATDETIVPVDAVIAIPVALPRRKEGKRA